MQHLSIGFEIIPNTTNTALLRVFGKSLNIPWIARIAAMDGEKPVRIFVQGYDDFTRADKQGIKGVVRYFTLAPGVYEFKEPIGPVESRRYFVCVENNQCQEICWRQVKEFFQAPSAG